MIDIVSYTGKIVFEPPDLTKKHKKQSDWKKVAFVEFDSEICELYSWFIRRRYNLVLKKSIRLPHVTIINDSIRDLTKDGIIAIDDVNNLWETAKEKWNGKEIELQINVDVRTNGKIWWMELSEESENNLQNIRNELNLKSPYFSFHLTIGSAHPKYEEHSIYIYDLVNYQSTA